MCGVSYAVVLVVVVEASAPKVYPRVTLASASTLSGSVVRTLRGGEGLPKKPSRQCRLLVGRLGGGWFESTSRLSVVGPWVPVCLLGTPSIVSWLPRGCCQDP